MSANCFIKENVTNHSWEDGVYIFSPEPGGAKNFSNFIQAQTFTTNSSQKMFLYFDKDVNLSRNASTDIMAKERALVILSIEKDSLLKFEVKLDKLPYSQYKTKQSKTISQNNGSEPII